MSIRNPPLTIVTMQDIFRRFLVADDGELLVTLQSDGALRFMLHPILRLARGSAVVRDSTPDATFRFRRRADVAFRSMRWSFSRLVHCRCGLVLFLLVLNP